MTAGEELSDIGGKIAKWVTGGTSGKQEGKKPSESSAPAANPYQSGADRIRTTATWLTGALAAVATVMLAGTQLSSIGALSFSDDGWRLGAAVVSVVLAVVAVAYAIYRLSFVQAPVETGLLYIQTEAAKSNSLLVKMANADRGLRANYENLTAFLSGYDQLRVAEYDAETALGTAETAAAQPTDNEALR